ncbi:glycan-binding surface protein [uncultured Chitinophaga sp.]|jgi:IPT/TIG domain.|uniref:glycan-binding surface protein n=1 Tax=uncultured Chitinophaga sp. TaxID=339340 RepID=UPI00262125D9|nr:glycan-binding surface protein [uncultured Chitinophaga sp.]
MTKHILIAIMCCLVFAFCKKDEVSAPPLISSVSLLDPAKQDSAFNETLPGTLILITGSNLGGIVNIYFNGQPAYFNPTYNTNTHLIVTIPGNAPTEATDPNVPNNIRVVTTHGETSYSFVLTIPPPAISAISNENALPGDSLVIWGNSLWLIDKIIFPGGREVTDFNADAAGTRVGLIMPDLGSDTGRLIIQAKYGIAKSDGPLNDHQSGDVISNLTNWEDGETAIFNWAWWGANRTDDKSLFPGTRGAYLQNIFGGVGANNGAWWDGNRSGNFTDVSTIFDASIMTRQAADYALKFEINTKEPWTAGINVLRMGEEYAYRFMPWASATTGVFDTEGKWQTVTVRLSDFKKADNGIEGTGANAAVMGDLLKAGGVVAFTYRYITEDAPVDVHNTAYDNFRIVKIR